MPYTLTPIGTIRSLLTDRHTAPRQRDESAPQALIELDPQYTDGLLGLNVGDDLILLTWLHESRRETLQVHPRRIANAPLTGVFATRSPDRPNPIGLHEVKLLKIEGPRLLVDALECVDGTPVLDIKPRLCP